MLEALDRGNHTSLVSRQLKLPLFIRVHLHHRLLALGIGAILSRISYLVPVNGVGLNRIENNLVTVSLALAAVVGWLRCPRLVQFALLIGWQHLPDLCTHGRHIRGLVRLLVVYWIFKPHPLRERLTSTSTRIRILRIRFTCRGQGIWLLSSRCWREHGCLSLFFSDWASIWDGLALPIIFINWPWYWRIRFILTPLVFRHAHANRTCHLLI